MKKIYFKVLCLFVCLIASAAFGQIEHNHSEPHQNDNSLDKRIIVKNPSTQQLQEIAALGLDLHCGAKSIGNDLRLDISGSILHNLTKWGLHLTSK